MKKILLIIICIFSIMLASCSKEENELVFESSTIKAVSFFNDSEFSFECDKVSQIEDGEANYDYFNSTYSFNELKEKLKTSEYYVEDSETYIRFLKDGTYYYLKENISKRNDSYGEFMLSSERVIFLVDGMSFFVPFPSDLTTNYMLNISSVSISSDQREYVFNYFGKMSLDNVSVTDDEIEISNLSNQMDKESNTLYTLGIWFDSSKMVIGNKS